MRRRLPQTCLKNRLVKLARWHWRLEAAVFTWSILFVVSFIGTVIVLGGFASPHGGPHTMFDGWILVGPGLLSFGFCLASLIFGIAAIGDLVRFRRRLRTKHLRNKPS